VKRCGFDSAGSELYELCPVVGCCEHNDEPLGFTKDVEFPDHLIEGRVRTRTLLHGVYVPLFRFPL